MSTPTTNSSDGASSITRLLRKHLARLERKREAIRGDLAESERAEVFRRAGEALLTYLHRVPKRVAHATLPDPAEPSESMEVELDPTLSPQANAARYFKRAAKAERGLEEIPGRLKSVDAEIARVRDLIQRIEAAKEADSDADSTANTETQPMNAKLARLLAEAYALLPPVLKKQLPPPTIDPTTPKSSTVRRSERQLPARLTPRRLRTTEGWDVLIGRTNEGNDHLTHHLARPEDYWFHVHGAPGSHVVLRRGKGKNEPSKKTLEEVAAWAAFYSQARTAGKVPVIFTRKKYVRRPRKGPPGLAICEREKTLIVRPVEPPRSALADSETD